MVKVIRHVDICIEETEDSVRMSKETIDERQANLLGGISFDGSDLSPEENERVTRIFRKWDSMFSKGSIDMEHTCWSNTILNLVFLNI